MRVDLKVTVLGVGFLGQRASFVPAKASHKSSPGAAQHPPPPVAASVPASPEPCHLSPSLKSVFAILPPLLMH